MEKIIFEVEDAKEANLLISIAKKLGITKFTISKTTVKLKEGNKKEMLHLLERGIDVSNFGNPSAWQKETRKDRIIVHKG